MGHLPVGAFLNKRLRIIGIDPGTVVTGYGIIEETETGVNYSVIDYGCIRPPKELLLSDRYLVLSNGVEHLLEKFHPDALVVETQFVRKNVQSAIKLGMARGITLIAAKKRGIPVFEYAPARAKQAATGNGQASKEQVQGMIRMLFKLGESPLPEDAADALALALCHANMIKFQSILEAQI